jgi:hypothetical protein
MRFLHIDNLWLLMIDWIRRGATVRFIEERSRLSLADHL